MNQKVMVDVVQVGRMILQDKSKLLEYNSHDEDDVRCGAFMLKPMMVYTVQTNQEMNKIE